MKPSELQRLIRENVQKVIKEQGGEMSDAEWLAEDIEQSFRKHFPNSKIVAKFSSNISPAINVMFTLGADKSEYSNGISHNDPIHTRLSIFGFGEDGNQKAPKITADRGTGGSVLVKTSDRMKAFDSVKVYRKISGKDPETVAKKFDMFFGKLKKALKDNIDNLPELPFDPESKL